MKCPKCNSDVPVLRTWRHTWWTPITCASCQARLHFEKSYYFRQIAPLMVCCVILVPAIALQLIIGNVQYSCVVLCLILVTLALSVKLLFFDLKRMKLVAKDEHE